LIKGKGSEITDPEVVNSRSQRKVITSVLMMKLIKIAKKKMNLKLAQSFRNTYYCLTKLVIFEGKMYGDYCKNRFCTVCSGYRKAYLINRYLPVVQKWEDPYFVTLTVKSVPAKRLNIMVDKVNKGFKRINNKYARRHQRGTGQKLVGIRTSECNYNPIKKTYNPHLHILVANRQMAEILVEEWLQLWGNKFTSRHAQFIRKVEDSERDLIEIIKYNTKIFTKPKKDDKKNNPIKIYVKAMYNIIVAMKGHRIINRFGFNLPKNNKSKENVITSLTSYDKSKYSLKDTDWVNEETGEFLSNYKLDPELKDLLKNKINTSLE